RSSFPSLPDRVRGDDDQQPPLPVRLYDNLPGLPAVSYFDHPAALDDVFTVAGRLLQHSPKVDLGESPVAHPLEHVGTELQLPVPLTTPGSWGTVRARRCHSALRREHRGPISVADACGAEPLRPQARARPGDAQLR